MTEFIEHAVELGKAGEAAVRRDVCDFHIRVQQKLLGVAHTRHLDVIDEREARDAFELVGQVVRADEKFFGDIIQRELLRIIAVDIAGDGVDLVGDGIVEFLGHIGVARAGLCDGTQEFHKFAVDGKLCQRRAGLLAQRENIVQVAEGGGALCIAQAVDGNLRIKGGQRLAQHAAQARRVRGNGEIDDQALARRAHGIFRFVQQRRAQKHDIIGLQRVIIALDDMRRLAVQQDVHLVKLMEMLELHIDVVRALVVIEKIIQRRFGVVDGNGIGLLVKQRCIVIHARSLLLRCLRPVWEPAAAGLPVFIPIISQNAKNANRNANKGKKQVVFVILPVLY